MTKYLAALTQILIKYFVICFVAPKKVSSYVRLRSLPTLRMSEVVIQKVAMAIRCTCGHLWLTTSISVYPTCPRCHSTISRKKHAVTLESDTTRKLKREAREIADSGSQVQNTASTEDGIDNGILQER